MPQCTCLGFSGDHLDVPRLAPPPVLVRMPRGGVDRELVVGEGAVLYVFHCTVEGGVEWAVGPLPLPRGGVTNSFLGAEGIGDWVARGKG